MEFLVEISGRTHRLEEIDMGAQSGWRPNGDADCRLVPFPVYETRLRITCPDARVLEVFSHTDACLAEDSGDIDLFRRGNDNVALLSMLQMLGASDGERHAALTMVSAA